MYACIVCVRLLYRGKFDTVTELVILSKHQRYALIFIRCLKQQNRVLILNSQSTVSTTLVSITGSPVSVINPSVSLTASVRLSRCGFVSKQITYRQRLFTVR